MIARKADCRQIGTNPGTPAEFARDVAPIKLAVGGYVDGNRQKDQHGKISGGLSEAWAGQNPPGGDSPFTRETLGATGDTEARAARIKKSGKQ
jgi:hypothetical protein